MNKKFVVCLMLVFGFVFGNQPSHYLFLKQQPVFIPDWRNGISIPNIVALHKDYFFTEAGDPNLTIDSTQMQKSPSDASRITLGKIALEATGAATGGYLTLGLLYGLSKCWPNLFNNFVGYTLIATSIPAGFTLGATITGNYVTEPNGSFVKSLIGSAVGTTLGSVIVYAILYASVPSDHPTHIPKMNLLSYTCITVAAFLPVSGAVIGYNQKTASCCLIGVKESEDSSIELIHLNEITLKLQVITINF